MNKIFLFRDYCDWPYQTAVFVEANNQRCASVNISRLIGALYGCAKEDVSFYNIDSYTEFMDEKDIDDDLDFRLFESRQDSDGVTSWLETPLFLTPPEPGVLTRHRGRLQRHLEDSGVNERHQIHCGM
jgi:hypothetical protein